MDIQNSSKLNFMFMPTLKHLALVKLASMLWNGIDVRHLIYKNFSYDHGINENYCPVFEKTVIQKVPELQLPRELEENLISYIYPVGFKIFSWIHGNLEFDGVTFEKIPSEFFWTPQGNIDSRKVAEMLVKDESLKINVRFKFACFYCLEEYIYILFNDLPIGYHRNPDTLPIVRYWLYYVAGEIDQLLRFHHDTLGDGATFWQAGLQLCAYSANWEGTRFFFQKCTLKERAELLLKTAASECIRRDELGRTNYQFSNTLCYLLSEMNVEEQSELLSVYPSSVLYYLLNWPWQNLFLRIVKEKETYLHPKDFYSLLLAIVRKISFMPQGFIYKNLFCEFWQLSSSAHKRYIILNEGLQSMSHLLFSVGDKESIKFIFKEATMEEKEKFILCPAGLSICRDLIQLDNWKLLNFFIRECISSKEIWEFKKKLKVLSLYLFSFFDFIGIVHILNGFYKILLDVEQEKKKKYINNV